MEESKALELIHIFHSIAKLSNEKRDFGKIGKGDFFLMAFIDAHCHSKSCSSPGITVSLLSKKLEMSISSVSKHLRSIEEKGYIKRVSDKDDRRVVYIALTLDGKKLLCEAKKQANLHLASLLEKLGAEDSEELLRLANKLLSIIKQEKQNNF